MKSYIIGETAYNHEGDFDYLIKMTEEIGDIGLNAIKYHLLFQPGSYMVKSHPLFDEMKQWIFSREQWIQIFELATQNQLDIIALCDDVDSLGFINEVFPNIFAVELHATGLNDFHLLKEASEFPGKVILGVGGSTLDEIYYAVEFLRNKGKEDILLMYGFQSYPTNYADINLLKMLKLRNLLDLPVGYADHTAYNDPNNEIISCMGAMMGIPILEKHYTPDFGVERIDYHAAVGKDQMKRIKALMELAIVVHGDGSLKMSKAEQNYGNTGPMKKAIVAGMDIGKGEILKPENLVFRRTEQESPLKQSDFNKLIGLKTIRGIKRDKIIVLSDVEYTFKTANSANFDNIERD